MPFVNNTGEDGEEDATDVAAGGPPALDDIDWSDPDTVKVHYNLAGWTFDQRAELSETLAEHAVPHIWDGEELVIPEAIEGPVDQLFDALEAELGPFPILLDQDEPGTEFGLDEWPRSDLETLKEALIEAEISHRWEGRTLVVATDAEHVVDDLLDAIEAGEVASLDENAAAPDGALHDLYVAADRLARDATHGASRNLILELVPTLSPKAPPFGIAGHAWAVIAEAAQRLLSAYEDGREPAEIKDVANDLRVVCRPYV